MRRLAAALAIALLLAAAQPLARRLRAESPVPPQANRLGVGRLLGGVLTGSFRPLLLNYLWIRSEILYGQGRFDELQIVYRMILSLYPNNDRAREYLGFVLAYNQKGEARDEDLAWIWAEEGLDILADGNSRLTLANWFLKQCGQNAVWLLRYAGPDWQSERRWRARARAWGERRFGASLDRFELGLRALEGGDTFYDRAARAALLAAQLLDDWMRAGRSDRFDETIAALRWVRDDVRDYPPLALDYARQLRRLEELRAGKVTEELTGSGDYRVAAAYWALGAHRRDAALLRAALATLDGVAEDPCAEERAAITRWLAFVESGAEGEPPPLPFD